MTADLLAFFNLDNLLSLGAMIGIYALIVVGLNAQWGLAGLFNVGVAGFFAVGAYVSAILTSVAAEGRLGGYGLPIPLGWAAAMVGAAVAAWLIGKVCLRFRSDYLAIATIGAAEVMRLFIKTESAVTGGPTGVSGVPRPFEGATFLGAVEPYRGGLLSFALLTFAVLAVVYVLYEMQLRSPWGRMMRAIRDNEDAARAMGKNIEARRMEAFVFGAAVMGLAGAVYAHMLKGITPEALDPMVVTFIPWIMLILGGSGNNRGAILGAFAIWFLWSFSDHLTGMLPTEYAVQAKYLRMFLIGLVLQFVLRFAPAGLLPERAGGR